MTRGTSLLVTGCLLWSCAGCTGLTGFGGGKASVGNETVRGSMDAAGGLKAWRSAGAVRADAIVTVYDDDGVAAVNRHEQVIRLHRGRLWASARVPEGQWSARADARGNVRFNAGGADLPAGLKGRLLESLGTMLHRLRGPMNLCGYGETPGESQPVRVDGMDLVRVSATGGAADVKAYYFDAATGVLRLVTAGADRPGADGTVTVYDYEKFPNGMAMPTRLSVVKIGEHVLVGDQPVLEIQYSNVRF
ncbi:MAG TPA: hypothetical protein VFJ30_15220 [Phycisphaerae bacterium]|nr:hypothetical protein [Phycisphaerae bacterium]